MNAPSSEERSQQREFIEICDWESFQYSGSHRKPDPPWPWFRLHNNFIESQTWFAMTKPQQADFVTLLSLVSRFGNLIPKDMKWLRSHGISSKTLPSLEQLSLIRVFWLPADDLRIKQLRSTLSGGTPLRGEERREEENRKEETKQDAPKRAPGIESTAPPISNLPNGNSPPRAKKQEATKKEGFDPRSWDELKKKVVPHIQRYGSDSDLIYRFHGSELGMSPKQVATCVEQLVADCEVTLPVEPMTTQ
jgi:hypothetical protein